MFIDQNPPIQDIIKCLPSIVANALKFESKCKTRAKKRITTARQDQKIVHLAKWNLKITSTKFK